MTARPWAAGLVCLMAVPGPVFAHSPIQGIDNFYNGLLHPAFVPAHLLLLLALGLLIGQQGARKHQAAIGTFIVTTLLGLTAAWFSIGGNLEPVLLAGAALLGILVAVKLPMSPHLCLILAALAGFFLGMDSAQDSLDGNDRLVALFGTGVGIYVLLFYPMALADYFNSKPWQVIGVRIIGSWIAASALMVLALAVSVSS